MKFPKELAREITINACDCSKNNYDECHCEWNGQFGVNDKVEKLIELALVEYGAYVKEECAKVAEGGRFLHDDAPDARLGRACAKAIREMEVGK